MRISDYWITGLVAVAGVGFAAWMWAYSPSQAAFWRAFTHPLVWAGYYLWVKALVLDVKRIRDGEEAGPGFVYWFYGMSWFVLWAINDMAYKTSQFAGVLNNEPGWGVRLYFANNGIFWLLTDGVTSAIIWPLRRLLVGSDVMTKFVLLDFLKSLVLFVCVGWWVIY